MPIAKALGLAYTCQDLEEVLGVAGEAGADSRYCAAIASMLVAAYVAQNLPEDLGADVEERTDVAELLDELLEFRSARYRRAPQYAARFRRKKC